MQGALDENAKRRLTDRAEISVAVEFMLSRGFSADDIPSQLVKFYYVDIDLLNEVLLEDKVLSAPIPSAETIWQQVA
jgi:ribosomal protein S24E